MAPGHDQARVVQVCEGLEQSPSLYGVELLDGVDPNQDPCVLWVEVGERAGDDLVEPR